MHNFSLSIRNAITQYGIVNDPQYGQVYAFEVDGFGSGKFDIYLHFSWESSEDGERMQVDDSGK